ncbi:competence protein CoiA [Lysinibacillus piscis]|uniref:Competence protein CoiA n=1 Tax=Lysinibacillus piscis TaxID=2518931 RepID=A0ABQ5NI30_9BACI|nr:competence protein CoiA [Lysinibacillus sp. KH24]GLC87741.1 hypothetical protein LYSBPC_08680 [Lysinibacillus sp. KH24]
MLTAYNEQQILFLPYQYTREDLKKIRKEMQFYCPQCQQHVQLKIGQYNIPHFAHPANNRCDQLFSEGESKLHLAGKKQLFEWLKQWEHFVTLEPYLSNLAQRPDILVTKGQQQIAIEFQCSAISHEKWSARTAGYQQHHIQPLWLFQLPKSKHFLQGIHRITIPPIWQKTMIPTKYGLSYIMLYDAVQAQFIYVTNLLPVHGHTFIGKVQELPLQQQHFPFYEPRSITQAEFYQYWQLYKQYCSQFVYRRLAYSKAGVQDPFLRSCYELQFSLTAMPDYIGIPLKDAEVMSMFSSEWQIFYHYFCHQLQVLPHELNDDNIQLFLTTYHMEMTNQALNIIQNYRAILEKEYLKRGNIPNFYQEVYNYLQLS